MWTAACVIALLATAAPGERHRLLADEGFDFLHDALAPVVTVLFDDLEDGLRAEAKPLPERVQRLLAPWFRDQSAGAVVLSTRVIERARIVVDAERMRDVFALAPTGVAAVTVGDVIAFSGRTYQPGCIEGVALIGHELVHVAQYAALGKQAFLERYFLGEALESLLTGGDASTVLDTSRDSLEIAAYCHQERICRALARTGELPPCGGKAEASCPTCPRSSRPMSTPHSDVRAGSPRKLVATR